MPFQESHFCDYVALLRLQAQLKDGTVAALQKAVPTLTKADIASMQEFPDRSFDPAIMQVRSWVSCQSCAMIALANAAICLHFAFLLAHVYTLCRLRLQEPALYRLQEAVQHYGEGAS